ncbi:MAG: hypothetical protein MUO67_24320 [Anaerolineales bacterium]|nr:hypothetical protein [Anaerolineales bacterium]
MGDKNTNCFFPICNFWLISTAEVYVGQECDLPLRAEVHVGQVCYLPLFAKSKIEEYSKHELLKAADTAKILAINKSKGVQIIPPGEIQ